MMHFIALLVLLTMASSEVQTASASTNTGMPTVIANAQPFAEARDSTKRVSPTTTLSEPFSTTYTTGHSYSRPTGYSASKNAN